MFGPADAVSFDRRMRLQPQDAAGADRIDSGFARPRGLITRSVRVAVVAAAQWDDEFVAHLAPESAVLRKAESSNVSSPS